MRRPKVSAVFGSLLASFFATFAHAGVSSSIQYVEPKRFSVGVEPEIVFSAPAGVAGNLRYMQGLNEMTNLGLVLGTGGGTRGFRLGATAAFEFFPDLESQPGIGLTLEPLYVRAIARDGTASGRLELKVTPYLRKAFQTGTFRFEPYLAVPFGMALQDSLYKGISSFVVGSQFPTSDKVKFNTELGMAINNTESYFSGGVAFFY
jgi:hypothetical protein